MLFGILILGSWILLLAFAGWASPFPQKPDRPFDPGSTRYQILQGRVIDRRTGAEAEVLNLADFIQKLRGKSE